MEYNKSFVCVVLEPELLDSNRIVQIRISVYIRLSWPFSFSSLH